MTVQLVNGVPVVQMLGKARKLAAFTPTPELKATRKRFADVHPVPDPSKWKDIDLANTHKVPVLDQGNNGSGTGYAGVTALVYARAQAGLDIATPLSCTFPYAQVNGGKDVGASLASILAELEKIGTCTLAECGAEQIFKKQIPQSAYETAQQYRIADHLLISTFAELCEAINSGVPTVFSIGIGENFSRLDGYGICPLPSIVVGNQALCGVGLKRAMRGGTWLVKFQNSWGPTWGQKGFAYLSQGHFVHLLEAYAVTHPVIVQQRVTPVMPVTKAFVAVSTKATEQPKTDMKAVGLAIHTKHGEQVPVPPKRGPWFVREHVTEPLEMKVEGIVFPVVPKPTKIIVGAYELESTECGVDPAAPEQFERIVNNPIWQAAKRIDCPEHSLLKQVQDDLTPSAIHTDPEAVVPLSPPPEKPKPPQVAFNRPGKKHKGGKQGGSK